MSATRQSTEPPAKAGLAAELPWVLAAFFTMLGARLWLLNFCGTSLPYWDNWDDTHTTYIPFFEGRLRLADLISPHAEHRLFFTRVNNLFWILLNGQWDNHVLTLVNAVLHAATLTGLGWLAARLAGARLWPWLLAPCVLAVALPFAWENSVGGMHSMFYFMLVFSLLALWLLGFHEPFTARWWGGVVAAGGGLFTTASGLIAPAAVVALVGLKILRQPASWKKYWPTVAVCLLAVAAGLALKVEAAHHEVLKAHSVMEFLISLGRYLAWPWIVLPPFAAFNVLPLALLAWVYWRERELKMPAEELILAVGAWTLLQCAAGAYARGVGGAHPQWRYMDSTSFVMIVNAWSLVVLGARHRARLPFVKYFPAVRGLWVLACATGLVLLCWRAWTVDIPERQLFFKMQRISTHSYLATGDVKHLRTSRREYLVRFEGNPALPQDHTIELTKLLDAPLIHPLLPAVARDPLKVSPERAAGFVTNNLALDRPEIPGVVIWDSLNEQGAANCGEFLSRPVQPSRLPYLEIPVAGDLGQPGLSLELIELSTGRRIHVQPSSPPGRAWKNIHVRAPEGAFQLVARDDSATGWLAFKEPREMGRLSLWALWALAAGRWIFFAALAVFFALAARQLMSRRPEVQD